MYFQLNLSIMQEIRAVILKRLYEEKRKKPHSWIDIYSLAEELDLSKEEIEFHLSYLEEKGFVKCERFIGGGGIVKIAALGVDAVENPDLFVKDSPFLQQLIIFGDVKNSTILQAESVKIRNGLNRLGETLDDEELKALIREIIAESRKENPDGQKLKDIFGKIKEKSPKVAEKIMPYVLELLKKWLGQ